MNNKRNESKFQGHWGLEVNERKKIKTRNKKWAYYAPYAIILRIAFIKACGNGEENVGEWWVSWYITSFHKQFGKEVIEKLEQRKREERERGDVRGGKERKEEEGKGHRCLIGSRKYSRFFLRQMVVYHTSNMFSFLACFLPTVPPPLIYIYI